MQNLIAIATGSLALVIGLAAVSAGAGTENLKSWLDAAAVVVITPTTLAMLVGCIAGVALGFVIALWRRRAATARPEENPSRNLISKGILTSPPAPVPWYVELTFGLSGADVTISLDVQYANGGVGGGDPWRNRNRYFLHHLERVAKGETIRLELCTPHTEDGVLLWYWARSGWIQDKNKLEIVAPNFARCRIFAECSRNQSGAYHFISVGKNEPNRIGEKPQLFGEHFFYYGNRWEDDGDLVR